MPNNLSAQIEQSDINDVFEDILFSEDKIVEQGYREGFQIGVTQDNIEGYHLGYHRGAEIGSEVGYYQEFAEFHLSNCEKSKIPVKIVKSLEFLQEDCKQFPKTNVEEVDIFDSIEKIRGRYKKIAAQLKIKIDFKKDSVNF
ncbi:hypothetical protein ABEB36_002105 [Hypothenemus hampei]|uniref:Uncharacterized protein n=1 Tax=Hypothenemus hampei TaxID=57062 RepID=A0ABD1F660_HYPHA